MIRIETSDGWLLVTHQDHARLAGAFGRLWGNTQFPVPQPLEDILVAVSRHDDAWSTRDAQPLIAPDGTPSAFSSELVGTYSAFENIDLEAYLGVRGAATEAVAGENPLAAVLISMHTVNLLTEQADLSTLSPPDRELHSRFIDSQLKRQAELKNSLPPENALSPEDWDRAFKFLQACDSFSLTACVGFKQDIPLRHEHPVASGGQAAIICKPETGGSFRLEPYPLAADSCHFEVPARRITGKTFSSDAALQSAYADGAPETIAITAHR
jgi:hypothetical protein